MTSERLRKRVVPAAMLIVGMAIGAVLSPLASAPARGEAQAMPSAPSPTAVYELRTYTTN